MNILKKFLSRSYIILIASIVLLATHQINVSEFLSINGINYFGTGIKDYLDKRGEKK